MRDGIDANVSVLSRIIYTTASSQLRMRRRNFGMRLLLTKSSKLKRTQTRGTFFDMLPRRAIIRGKHTR